MEPDDATGAAVGDQTEPVIAGPHFGGILLCESSVFHEPVKTLPWAGRVFRGMVVLALWMAAGAHGQSASEHTIPHTKHSLARKLKLEGVPGFSEVTPRLYRGGQPTHAGFEGLAKKGIDIVVDVRGTKRDGEGREVNRLGMKYVSIPWHCPFPRDEVFARFLRLIKENPGKKIFVHCRLGDDRGGMMIASYRMAADGWSAKEAMAEMKAFGFSRSHHFICPGLARYGAHFPEHLRTNPIFDGLGTWEQKEASK
jgi:protein tyrosine phosphatase (PTP) superfamily phosphohydrolase (DUF442 family)